MDAGLTNKPSNCKASQGHSARRRAPAPAHALPTCQAVSALNRSALWKEEELNHQTNARWFATRDRTNAGRWNATKSAQLPASARTLATPRLPRRRHRHRHRLRRHQALARLDFATIWTITSQAFANARM